jgi:putative nucleotidyltransferase with HDIG domain
MPTKAKIFVALVITGGWLALVQSLLHWQSHEPVNFIVYFLLTVFASGLKLQLPGVTGTMSVCFFFILIGLVSLSLPEVLLTGCSAVLVQYAWQSTKKLRAVQLLFNLGSVSLAIITSYQVFHSPFLRSLPIELAVLLAIMATTYFITNTFSVAAVIALTESKSLPKVWREYYLWSFPYYLLGAATAGLFEIAKHRLGWQTSMLIIPVSYLVYRSYGLHLGRLDDAKKHAEETAALHMRTIESLAVAIEAKDHTTHDHLQRVKVYAMEIGKELRLNESELDALRAASLLHDIGKIAVPEYIISKPGKLTPEEFEKMKVHPLVGAEILERAKFPYPVVPIVRSHHEKWDGSGYPFGLKGEQIPIGARILSVVDCLDALASDRQYRRAMPLPMAMEIVTREAGRSFDPRVVEVLKRRHVELERMARALPVETFSLSTDIKVERGAAPDAGFEQASSAGAPPPRVELGSLLETLPSLRSVLSFKEIFLVLGSRLEELMPFDHLVAYVRREAQMVPEYVSGANTHLFESLRIPVGSGISGWVAENNRPIVNGNPSVEHEDLTTSGGLRSTLAVPLKGSRNVVGVLSLYRREPDAFTSNQLRILAALGSELAKSLESSLSGSLTLDRRVRTRPAADSENKLAVSV